MFKKFGTILMNKFKKNMKNFKTLGKQLSNYIYQI